MAGRLGEQEEEKEQHENIAWCWRLVAAFKGFSRSGKTTSMSSTKGKRPKTYMCHRI